MKRIAICFLLLILTFAANNPAQPVNLKYEPETLKTNSNARLQKKVYYISIARSNAGQFSKKQWQKIADTLKKSGMPAFFADHESLPSSQQIREEWLFIRINKRLSAAAADALMLGPFASRKEAGAAVGKFSRLMSDEGRPLNQDYPGNWSFGSYIIMGVRTK